MDEAFIGSLITFLGAYAPQNWLPCNGQVLPIRGYEPLYSIIGNRYGGSVAQNTFALPSFNPDGKPDSEGRYVLICVNGVYPARSG